MRDRAAIERENVRLAIDNRRLRIRIAGLEHKLKMVEKDTSKLYAFWRQYSPLIVDYVPTIITEYAPKIKGGWAPSSPSRISD